MKVGEAKALAAEYNSLVASGRVLWEQATELANRCNAIRNALNEAGVEYDEIALLFGGELDIDVVGDDDRDLSPMRSLDD